MFCVQIQTGKFISENVEDQTEQVLLLACTCLTCSDVLGIVVCFFFDWI